MPLNKLPILLLFACLSALAEDSTATNNPTAVEPDSGLETDDTTPSKEQKLENSVTNVPQSALAAESTIYKSGVGGEGSLGWIATRGNTNSKSLNADLKIDFRLGSWLHNFSVKAKQISEDKVVTSERYLYTQQARLSLSEHTYIFEAARYDDDRFDGFDYQASVTFGVGWFIIESDRQNLDLEFGTGYRQTALSALSGSSGEKIGRLSQHYDVRLSETSELIEDLLVEAGESNTTTEITTAFKVSINNKLALKLSYNVKQSSDPQPGKNNTDRTTSANLVYGF